MLTRRRNRDLLLEKTEPTPFAAKAKDLGALRDAVVDDASVSAGLCLSYLFVRLYFAVAAGAAATTIAEQHFCAIPRWPAQSADWNHRLSAEADRPDQPRHRRDYPILDGSASVVSFQLSNRLESSDWLTTPRWSRHVTFKRCSADSAR